MSASRPIVFISAAIHLRRGGGAIVALWSSFNTVLYRTYWIFFSKFDLIVFHGLQRGYVSKYGSSHVPHTVLSKEPASAGYRQIEGVLLVGWA